MSNDEEKQPQKEEEKEEGAKHRQYLKRGPALRYKAFSVD